MTRKANEYLWLTRVGACLALAFMVLAGGAPTVGAEGESAAGVGARAAAAAVPIRTAPENRGRQRLAEERAMVNALAGKRDPFKVPPPPKIGGGKDDPTDGPMLPGVRGLVIGQLRLKGIVREEDSHTMIAVVSNGSNLAYFLHIHEDVYNGVVSRITPDAIYFLQKHPDSGGRLEAREVVLKLVSRGQEAR